MKAIRECRTVRAPFARAPEYLKQYVRDLFTEHNGRLTLSVAMPVRRSNGDPVEVREDVLIDFEKIVELRVLTGKTAIAWRPVHGRGMIPSFSGLLVITPDEDDDSCGLLLQGGYEPPLGPVGALFDAVAGNALARETAQRLLKRIALDIESKQLKSTTASPTACK